MMEVTVAMRCSSFVFVCSSIQAIFVKSSEFSPPTPRPSFHSHLSTGDRSERVVLVLV